MKSHAEILNNLYNNKESLEAALGIPYIWIRGKEFLVDKITDERADLVFQDEFNPFCGCQDATCFVLELKTEQGDHELLGQIKKYTTALQKRSRYGHWGKIKGIALAPEFCSSTLDMLWKEKIKTFLYHEGSNGLPILTEQKMSRKPVRR
jgi:hypothetical protein